MENFSADSTGTAESPNPSIGIIEEVHSFLDNLRREFSRLFRSPKPPPQPRNAPTTPMAGLKLRRREEARAIITERVVHWGKLIGVEHRRIAIKDQKTLWGSCSRHRNLSFNWRLILAPPEILDYVVIHELVHLLEMNHSRKFWEKVSLWCSDHKSHRRWLRENGRNLLLG